MPFGFHLAMDTLPSGITTSGGFRSALAVSSFRLRARLGLSIPSTLSGQRGITPAFGYDTPHPSIRGTLTLLNSALLSAYYATVRLPTDVHVGLRAQGLLQPARRIFPGGHRGGLPVLARGVSIHAWGLRLRRGPRILAIAHPPILPSAMQNDVGTLVAIISQLNTRPACAPVNASMAASRLATHDSGSGWFATPFLCDSFIHDSTPVYPGALRTLLVAIGKPFGPAAEWLCGDGRGDWFQVSGRGVRV